MALIDPDEHERELERFTRFHQGGRIAETATWPRRDLIGDPGRQLELSTDRAFTNGVITVLGGDSLAGAGFSPTELRRLAAGAIKVAEEIERRHGRSEHV